MNYKEYCKVCIVHNSILSVKYLCRKNSIILVYTTRNKHSKFVKFYADGVTVNSWYNKNVSKY